MTNLYIKQKVWSIKDRFTVYDELQNVLYTAESKVFSVSKQFWLKDNNDNLLRYIHSKVWSILPRFYVEAEEGGDILATINQEWSFFHKKFTIAEYDWHVLGDFFDHEYSIRKGDAKTGPIVATVSKRWFSWGDTYQISIVDDSDIPDVLCTILVIDYVIALSQSSSVHVSSSSH